MKKNLRPALTCLGLAYCLLFPGCGKNEGPDPSKLAVENTPELCADSLDNDHDGHPDCEDQECEELLVCFEGQSCEDQSGDAAASSRLSFRGLTIDQKPERISNDKDPTFGFFATEEGLSFRCKVDEGSSGSESDALSSFSDCTSPYSRKNLDEGKHTISILGLDEHGVTKAGPVTYEWTIDTTTPKVVIESGFETLPKITIEGKQLALTNQTTANFAFSADEAEVAFWCILDDATSTICASPKTYNDLGEGTHTILVQAMDQAGNLSTDPGENSYNVTGDKVTWLIDTTPPKLFFSEKPSERTKEIKAHFSFSAEVDETNFVFSCSLDRRPFENCSGTYNYISRYQDYQDLAEGEHRFELKATDLAGNESRLPPFTWVVDLTAPSFRLLKTPDQVTRETEAIFEFESAEDVSFDCSATPYHDILCGNTSYQACSTPNKYSNLNAGAYTFCIRSKDAVGNVSEPVKYELVIDLTAPVVTLVDKPPTLTNATSMTFEFSSQEPGTEFWCILDQGTSILCTSPHLYAGLAEGEHTFTVQGKDPVGNLSKPAAPTYNSKGSTATWTIDLTPPAISLTAKPDKLTNETSTTFSFSATGETPTFSCSLDGAPAATCTSSKSYWKLLEGEHRFELKATDKVGNIVSLDYSWVIDLTGPAFELIFAPDPLTGQSMATFEFESQEEGVTFQCATGSDCSKGEYEPCTSPYSKSYGVSRYSIEARFCLRAIDLLGNITEPITYDWTVDLQPPVTTLQTNYSYAINATTATFEFGADDALAHFECALDQGGFQPCTSPWQSPPLTVGEHTFEVRAIDILDNVGPTRSDTFEIAAIKTTFDDKPSSQLNATVATFEFHANRAATFECKLDTASYQRCSSPHQTLPLTVGSHTMSVRAIDEAGNVEDPPATASWTVTALTVTIQSKPPALTNAASVLFEVTASRPAAFECSFDTVLFYLCTNPMEYFPNEGSHLFQVRAVDDGNNNSPPVSHAFVIDRSPPTNVVLDGPDESAHPVTLSLNGDDLSGVTGYCLKDDATQPTPSDSCWHEVSATPSFAMEVPYPWGTSEVVYLYLKDRFDHISYEAIHVIDIDNNWVNIPGGTYQMGTVSGGDSDERPVHQVTLSAYRIQKFEVTAAEFEAFVDGADFLYTVSSYDSTYNRAGYENRPINYVSWFEAQFYCQWLGGFLPTEAQWEYAARGSDGWTYPWGDDNPEVLMANYNANYFDETAPVGYYHPDGISPFGLYDMAGNVREWVADWYGTYPSGAQVDPTGPSVGTYKVLRGGGWDDDANGIRAANRLSDDPGQQWGSDLGFRCAAPTQD